MVSQIRYVNYIPLYYNIKKCYNLYFPANMFGIVIKQINKNYINDSYWVKSIKLVSIQSEYGTITLTIETKIR